MLGIEQLNKLSKYKCSTNPLYLYILYLIFVSVHICNCNNEYPKYVLEVISFPIIRSIVCLMVCHLQKVLWFYSRICQKLAPIQFIFGPICPFSIQLHQNCLAKGKFWRISHRICGAKLKHVL